MKKTTLTVILTFAFSATAHAYGHRFTPLKSDKATCQLVTARGEQVTAHLVRQASERISDKKRSYFLTFTMDSKILDLMTRAMGPSGFDWGSSYSIQQSFDLPNGGDLPDTTDFHQSKLNQWSNDRGTGYNLQQKLDLTPVPGREDVTEARFSARSTLNGGKVAVAGYCILD